MSKSFSKLQRLLLVLASIFVFASVTVYPTSSASAKPGIVERAKAGVAKAKEKIKKGEEAIEELKEKGAALKMAAVQAVNESKKFKEHWDKFQADFGPRDCIGRSFWHFLYIVGMWSGILALLYKKEDYDRSPLGFAWRFAVAFLLAVFFGFYFELLRSSNIIELMHAIDEAPDVPGVSKVVSGWNGFWQVLYYLLPAGAGIVWAAGMISQRKWLHKIGHFTRARHMKVLKSFLRYRALPQHILQLAPATGVVVPSAVNAQAVQPATQAVPAPPVQQPADGSAPQAPQSTVEPAAPPAQPIVPPFVPPKATVTRYCPRCATDVEVKPKANFCANCGGPLKKEVATSASTVQVVCKRVQPSLYEIWLLPPA